MPLDNPIPPDLEKKLYLDGIHLFNDHEYFEAHEVWEDVWHMAYGTKKSFYQGIIQCSVSLEHYRRSSPRGVVAVYNSYRPKFRHVPDTFMGLNVKQFLAEMKEILRPVTEANPPLPEGSITLDLTKTPRIELLYDPFETGEAERYNRPEKF